MEMTVAGLPGNSLRLRTFPVLERRGRAAIAFAAAAAGLGTIFGFVFGETIGIRAAAAEVASATYLGAAALAVIPLTILLVARDPRAVEAGCPGSAAARLVLLSVALLSASAAAIHFASIDTQSAGYWLFYLLFSLLAAFQLAWAMGVLVYASRFLHVVGALANAGTIGVWIWSRTSGLPFGPTAHMAESIAFADAVATAEEAAIVVGIVWLLTARAIGPPRSRGSAASALVLSLLLIAPTALALISAAGTHLLVPPSD
jgi:hypothetical protein